MPTSSTPCHRCGGCGVEPDLVAIGRAFRALRKKAGLTLREVARRSGYSAPYISDLELGRRPWGAKVTAKCREALK